MGTLQVVVDGQYGSTGKGAVCAYLARRERNPHGLSAVRVAGPNAGHTAVDDSGHRWPLRQIPVAAVVNPHAVLYIAAGSEIDISVLLKEVQALEDGGHEIRNRLLIDPMATVIEPKHHHLESTGGLVERIGSTGKGIGAARAARIFRDAKTVRDTDLHDTFNVGDTVTQLQKDLDHGVNVQIEGTQGYGLGLHHPNYPQVTSSDCRAIDFIAMAGINPWDAYVDDTEVWLVYRPYPIRVAGNSGPMLGETTWEELGLPQERTTVTQKVRRVGTWDTGLARAALLANGGPSEHVNVVLTMMDQLDPSIAGVTDDQKLMVSTPVYEFIKQVEDELNTDVQLVGTSDRTMVEL